MRALDIDLRSQWVAPRWALASVASLFVLALVLGIAAYRTSQTLEALKAQRAELLRQQAAPAQPPVIPQKMPYDESAREMLALATSQWPSMLTALESADTVGVTPTALEIMPAEHWIRVELEFTDYGKLLEYIDGLNAGESPPKWSLVQAQTASALAVGGAPAMSTASIKGIW